MIRELLGYLLIYGAAFAGLAAALCLAGMAVRWFVRGWRTGQAKSVRVVISIG